MNPDVKEDFFFCYRENKKADIASIQPEEISPLNIPSGRNLLVDISRQFHFLEKT
jgi:hypothetical protein